MSKFDTQDVIERLKRERVYFRRMQVLYDIRARVRASGETEVHKQYQRVSYLCKEICIEIRIAIEKERTDVENE